ncbi:PAS domain S-box protein [Massilia sp. PAMC28688]|nr:PAS domain S-box protein [Massilia sp. PAMC28688]
MWIAVSVQLRLERAASRNEGVAHSQQLARVLSEHVAHVLRQSDHATQLFSLKHEESGGAFPLAAFARQGGLLDSVLPARLELPMAVLDRNGEVTDALHGFGRAPLGQEAFFQSLAAGGGNAPLVSAVVVDSGTGHWNIRVARRLNQRGGQFDGALVMLIDPNLFIDDYDRIDVGERGAQILTTRDGLLSAGRIGERLFSSGPLGFRPRRAAGASSDEVLAGRPLDATARLYSQAPVPRYGLTAVVGIERAVALERYRRHRIQYLGVAGVASLMIAAIVALLMRQSTELRASNEAARKAQATLRAAADGSFDGVLIMQAWPPGADTVQDFVIVDINDRGAALFRRPRSALIGQRAFELLPRYRETGFFERYVEVFRGGRPVEEEAQIRLDQDAPRWIHHQIVPLDDGVAVTSRDITARKLAEIDIHNSRSFLQSLVDHLPLLIAVRSMRDDSHGVIMAWNKAAEAATGYSAAHVVGSKCSDVFPPDFALCRSADDQLMLANPTVHEDPERALVSPDGGTRYLRTISVPLFDDGGRVEFILCIAEDITVRREQEQNLRTNEAHLAAVTNASPMGIVRTDVRGNCIYVNRRFQTITGLTRDQSLGLGWLAAFVENERAHMPAAFEHQRSHEEPFERVTRCRRTDGAMLWVSTKIAAIRIGGRIEGFIGSMDDITVLRDAELAMRESEARLRTIADTLPTMVAYIDAGLVYRFHNRAYDREFGRDGIAVLSMTVQDTIGSERYAALLPYLQRALAGETVTFEEQDGQEGFERTLEVTYIPQRSDDGRTVIGFHVMRQDITPQKREKKRLLKLAQIDPLTGLANRAGFLHKLGDAMRASIDDGSLMALMYLDIDHFKRVNDTYGHQVGDDLLTAFSARLAQALRASDSVARLGGDEFTVIAESLGRREDADHLAAKIVAAMQAPFELDGVTVSISASIGLTYFCRGAFDPDGLIKEADRLLYQAKDGGRNTWRSAS